MAVTRVVPNFAATYPGAGRTFFTDVLGLNVAMEQDFITTYQAPETPAAQINVLNDPSGLNPDYSVGVDAVEDHHQRALAAGLEIVYPLREEPWGVRRFFVRDPFGRIANIVEHLS